MQLHEAPTNAPVFMEDLPEEQQDHTGLGKYGAGKCIRTPGLCWDFAQWPAAHHLLGSITSMHAYRPEEPWQHVLHE